MKIEKELKRFYTQQADALSLPSEEHLFSQPASRPPRPHRPTRALVAAVCVLALLTVALALGVFLPKSDGNASSSNAGDTAYDPSDPSDPFIVTDPTRFESSIDLMASFIAQPNAGKAIDQAFIDAQMSFSVRLLQNAVRGKTDDVLISPVSLQYALAMTANGAKGETLSEMESVLGNEMSIAELNRYLCSYQDELTASENVKVRLANAIWFRNEGFAVNPDFLQINADYYNAGAYSAPMNEMTRKEINAFISEHTDGLIEDMLEKLGPNPAMLLVNALLFDGEWASEFSVYKEPFSFTPYAGEKHSIDRMMSSTTDLYLRDGDQATGFIKSYKDDRYAFAVLLPNRGVDVFEYIADLSPEHLQSVLANPLNTQDDYTGVDIFLPEFSASSDLDMIPILKQMGMRIVFDEFSADLSGLGTSFSGNLYLSQAVQSTKISVTPKGTTAAAGTSVTISDECLRYTVLVDRPFVYMILDTETDLPLFIGVKTNIS